MSRFAMPANNISILITGDIDKALVEQLTSKGFTVDVIPFIKTASINSAIVQQQVEHISTLDATVIFTSANAVEAVHQSLSNKKINWKIYCVGEQTKSVIEKLLTGANVIGVADDAVHLSQKITSANNINEVYFFCGDKRRDTLPHLLDAANIAVHEVKVYTTTIFQHTLTKEYDAVLFFSPSAVKGLFAYNGLNTKTVLFSIGHTTAGEIKNYSSNKLIVTENPSKELMIKKLVAFFNE